MRMCVSTFRIQVVILFLFFLLHFCSYILIISGPLLGLHKRPILRTICNPNFWASKKPDFYPK